MKKLVTWKSISLSLCCLVSLAATALAGTNTWTRTGEGLDSVVNTVEVDPTRPERLYAGAEDGFYLSTDGGERWQVRGAELVDRVVLTLVADDRQVDRLYAGLTTGLYVSQDGGDEWTPGAGLDTGIFAIAPGRETDTGLYAGTFGRGVYVSRDGGGNWTAGGSELADDIIFALATSALEPGTVYAGTGRGLFVSRDGAASWERLGSELAGKSVRSLYVASQREEGGLILAGTFDAGVWQSTDLGKSWTAVNAGLGDLAVRGLAVDAEFSQLIYAATSTGGFFRTTDGGRSWRGINEGLPSLAARQAVVVPGTPRRLLGVGAAGGVWEINFAEEPQLVVARQPLLFGQTMVGSQQRSTLRLANGGEAPLNIASLGIEGEASFSVAGSSGSLAPGAALDVTVVFKPQTRGDKVGNLVLVSDDPDEPRVSIGLQGTGVRGELSANLARIHFGEVRIGSSKDTTVVLTNRGNAELALTNAFFAEDAFRVLSFQPVNLAPGERLLLRTRFVPLVARGVSSSLVLQSGTTEALEIAVDGVGTAPEIALATRRLDFGTVNPAVIQTRDLEIGNNGNTALTIDAIEVEGGAFSLAATLPLVIEAGDSTSVGVSFLPLISGRHEGRLRIISDSIGPFAAVEVALEGVGGGLTISPQPAIEVGEGAVDLLVADWNGDGAPDIAVADSAGGQVRVLINDATGTFFDVATYPGPSSIYGRWDEPVALAAVEVFGGGMDLVVADQVARSISILENDGQGRFDHRREDIYIGHRVADVLGVDLDADGDGDIAVANGDTASITLLFNNGQGSFNARMTRPVEAGPVALAAALLDGDDHQDLVVANRDAGTVSVLIGDRSGGFLPRLDFVIGLQPIDLELADYDADGDNDILVACRGSQGVVILENTLGIDGESRFAIAGQVGLRMPVIDLTTSDLTTDIFADLVGVGGGLSRLAFLENEAGEKFTSRDTLATVEPTRRAEIVDLTGDGANDIAVLGHTSLQLFVNQDSRRLDPPRPPTGVRAQDVARDLGRRIEVAWSAPELDEQIGRTTEYILYRARQEDGSYAPVDTIDAGLRSAIDPTATLADTFYYYVRAGNAALQSLPSDTVSAVSRPAPFFELQLVDEPRVSVGDTLKVRAFITPAEHRIAGISLYLTFDDSALALIPADTVGTPFRIATGLSAAPVLENQLHPNSTNRVNLSLAQLLIQPGVEPVELGEIWFRTEKDTVSYISVDDDEGTNRRSAVVEDSTGRWILPFIPFSPMQVSARDYQVAGQLHFMGREGDHWGGQVTLLFVDGQGDTLRSPLNDEDRLKPGIQQTLTDQGRFRLEQIPSGNYEVFAKVPTHLQGRIDADAVAVGDSLGTQLSFIWVKSDTTRHDSLPAGDANDDNRINLADFGVLARYFNVNSANLSLWTGARATDFDGNGQIDFDDLSLLADHFGEIGMEPGDAPVPAAAKMVGTGVRIEGGKVELEDLGAITGFSLLVARSEGVEVDLEGTIWQGRETNLCQWPEGEGTRVAGALIEPLRPVEGDGTLLFVGEAEGEGPEVLEVELLGADGRILRSLPLAVDARPRHSALLQNFPNPFNPTTVIPFVVGGEGGDEAVVRLEVFNALGQRVRLLANGPLPTGFHRMSWDGRDDAGRELASGLYIYRLQTGDFQQTKRLLLIR